MRAFLRTYRDPDGPKRVKIDLSEMSWNEAWEFVARVQDLAKRLEAQES